MFNPQAVGVFRGADIVGHVPLEISKTSWFFLRKRHSNITCKMTGDRHLSRTRGKGLVVPCLYIFEGLKNDIEKLIDIALTW